MYRYNPRLFVFVAFMLLLVACSNREESGSEINENIIASLFQHLHRNSDWQLSGGKLLDFTTHHTQGMTKVNGYFYMSSVEIQVRTEPLENDPRFDRTTGEGEGHLFKFDENGELIQSITLGESSIYHPGGIDFGGGFIWVPVAEYRPNSSTIIYKVDPETLEAEEVFRFPDHIGAVIFNSDQMKLYGYSWGARRIYTWLIDDNLNLKNTNQKESTSYISNPQHYIDYQDCQYLGDDMAICSGLLNYRTGGDNGSFTLGGIDLISLKTLQPIYQLPVELRTRGNNPRVMTQNPFFVEGFEDHLRFHFIPEDDESVHYVYEVKSIDYSILLN